jgi:hypothetical protein
VKKSLWLCSLLRRAWSVVVGDVPGLKMLGFVFQAGALFEVNKDLSVQRIKTDEASLPAHILNRVTAEHPMWNIPEVERCSSWSLQCSVGLWDIKSGL